MGTFKSIYITGWWRIGNLPEEGINALQITKRKTLARLGYGTTGIKTAALFGLLATSKKI